ncbi:MAG: hypothetical protein JNL01_03720 [Bdellovibrionales bacterium]|nr:hypothetical protein [Bdellovibrionales bacterium]
MATAAVKKREAFVPSNRGEWRRRLGSRLRESAEPGLQVERASRENRKATPVGIAIFLALLNGWSDASDKKNVRRQFQILLALVLVVPSFADGSDCREFLSRFPNHLGFFQDFPSGADERADLKFREYSEGTRGLYADLESVAPGFKLYHGTWQRSRVDAILEMGFIPQSGGQIFPGGEPYSGVYVVSQKHVGFAEGFVDRNEGGEILELDIASTAKVIDFRRAMIEGFVEDRFGKNYARFFSEVPVDIFIYDYPTRDDEVLMVIRNSRVIRDIRIRNRSSSSSGL